MHPATEFRKTCAVCDSDQSHFVLNVKDHSVSGEFFEVYECPRCRLRFTQNAPSQDHMGRYYQSDDYISHSNTKKGIVNSLYHQVRRHTLARKFRLIRKETGLKRGRHLDIGAGTGAFVQYMIRKGWDSTGIEPDEKARACAASEHDTQLLPAEDFSQFTPAVYDVITLWHVLEHVHDLYPYLHQIRKILKPGGLVFIAVPNYTSYDAQKYGADWAAYDVPRHLHHFSPDSIGHLMEATGFDLYDTVPMWYDSFYISLLSEQYANGRPSLIKGFTTGAISNMKALKDKNRCSSLIYVSKPKH